MTQAAKGNDLPNTFKFKWCESDTVYTATQDVAGGYVVTWESCPEPIHYYYRIAATAVKEGAWKILTDENQDMLTATNASQEAWKQHVECIDNDSRRVDDTQGETANVLSDLDEDYFGEDGIYDLDENLDDITLLDFIKEFSVSTGASVSIIDGTYTVLYNDACYNAECDCQLVEICNAITTLHLAEI